MQGKRIFVAMPQYKALPLDEEKRLAKHFGFKDYRPFGLHPMVSKSLFLLNKTYGKVHYAELNILRNDGMIERSRSHLFGGWLKEWKRGNRFDYFMCLDEDVEFHPSAIQSMIDADKDIIGGEYAYKTTEGLNLGKSVCKYLPDEIPDENGILKIRWLNGGFIFCKAEALLKIVEHYPELYYVRPADSREDIQDSYALWAAMVKNIVGDQVLLSEDYAFCERARESGFDIFLDTKIKLVHWSGTIGYTVGAGAEEMNKDGIPGWMDEEELAWLSEMAKKMESIVEIGSWKGRSTKVLLENCPGIVYAVDHFKGGPDITYAIAQKEDVYSQFIQNVGHFPNLRLLRMSSEEGAKTLDGKKVEMVFIDGDHSRKGFKKDIEDWLPKCKKLICGHDYQEVMYTVHELLGNVNVCGSIWWKEI